MLMFCLCMVAVSEGADASLFPANTLALGAAGFPLEALGWLSTVQALCQAFGGPFWGIVASNAIWERKKILAFGTVCQGLATVLMCIWLDPMIMLPLRCVNGFMLAALRPICNSIVGDRFDDTERGRYFGMIMSSMSAGGAAFGLYATGISRQKDYLVPGLDGWRFAFIFVGVFTMALGPLVWLCLKAPPVKQDPNHQGGIRQEFQTLAKLFRMWTFAGLIVQGCFGMIPWRAFEFRTFFFQLSKIPDTTAGTLNSIGAFAASAGNFIGGSLGDLFARMCPTQGRIMVAWISVFGGIPIAYLTFMVAPPEGAAVVYFGTLVVALGLVATWASASTNSPVLCAIASERERSLVLAWQTSLEGAIGALGGLAFTTLLVSVFGINQDCLREENFKNDPNCQDIAGPAGQALFWTSCVPWFFCGCVYMTLHLSYPKDLAATYKLRDEEQELALRATMM
jgi:MFS family permease